MSLKLYNTLTRKKENFKPIHKGQARMYVCGPTIYWYQHIGNLRSYIFSDTLRRTLEYNNYKVKEVMNITDVGHLTSDADVGEDKVELAAKKEGKTAKEITNFYLKIFKEDFKKLNITEPNIWSKATEHIQDMINLIKKLEKKGFTYKTDDGIYFDTSKFKNYGKLAKLKSEDLKAGSRISMKEKKNKTDFALWKFSEEQGKRQQEYKSPWGTGYPGWHIECSAMSMKYLGEHFDIHTGGEEHIPVHHTNEIAQAEAATGKKFVNYWLHMRWLLFKDEKMSKSKGHIYTISELEKKGYSALVYRYFCLGAHYRTPLNFSFEALDAAKNKYNSLKEKISNLKSSGTIQKNNYQTQFLKAINDDLNTPKALAILNKLLKDNKINNPTKLYLIKDLDKVLGLDLTKKTKTSIPKEILKLAEQREKARKDKDWKKSDELREKIKAEGFIIEDSESGFKIKPQ